MKVEFKLALFGGFTFVSLLNHPNRGCYFRKQLSSEFKAPLQMQLASLPQRFFPVHVAPVRPATGN